MERKELGRYLSYLKIESGMTYEDIDHTCGIPKSTISRLFNDKTASPSMDTVQKLFAAMGGSMADFEAGDWKKEPASVATVADDKTVSLESHLAVMDAYEKRLAAKDREMEARLAAKDKELESRLASAAADHLRELENLERHKDEIIASLRKDKRTLALAVAAETLFIIGLFVVDLSNPSIGWARWQAAHMMDSVRNMVNRLFA